MPADQYRHLRRTVQLFRATHPLRPARAATPVHVFLAGLSQLSRRPAPMASNAAATATMTAAPPAEQCDAAPDSWDFKCVGLGDDLACPPAPAPAGPAPAGHLLLYGQSW